MTRRGPWRFDGERYIPGPEYIDSPPFEMPEMTEDEQLQATLNYIENRYRQNDESPPTR